MIFSGIRMVDVKLYLVVLKINIAFGSASLDQEW